MTDQLSAPSDQHTFYMLLFNLILRHDDRLRLDVAEAIRRILQNPAPGYSLSPSVCNALQQLRDELLVSPNPELASRLSQPPVRLVDD